MIKVLHALSLLTFLSAGGLLVLCGVHWSRGAAPDPNEPGASLGVLQRFQELRGEGREEGQSPLIAEAMTFALHLQPARDPERPPDALSARAQSPPVPRPPRTTPKFRLLSTTCYRFHPEKSLALICEPGQNGCWVRPGERLGHVTIERIDKGAILYRDNDGTHGMSVPAATPVSLAKLRSPSGSTPGAGPGVPAATVAPPSEPGIRSVEAEPTTEEEPEPCR